MLTSTSGFPLISSCPFGLSSTSILAAAGLGGDDDDAYWSEGKGRPLQDLICRRRTRIVLPEVVPTCPPACRIEAVAAADDVWPRIHKYWGVGRKRERKAPPPGSLSDCRGCQMPTSNEAQVEKKEGRNGREGGREKEAYGCRRRRGREGCVSVRVCVSEASAWRAESDGRTHGRLLAATSIGIKESGLTCSASPSPLSTPLPPLLS